MDSGETFSKQLAELEKNIQTIQQKLKAPECAHIDQILARPEYQLIRKALLEQPNLFLLLLDSPAFVLFLTENTREGFLKDLKENPDNVMALLMQSQSVPSDESHPDEEVSLVQDVTEAITQVYEQVTTFAASYTPSMNHVRDTFGSFVEGLTCALNDVTAETVDPETQRSNTNQLK